MKHKIVAFFVLILALSACSSSGNQKTVDKNTFKDILMDIYLADGSIVVGDMESLSPKIDFYSFIYTKHDVTKEQFLNTLNSYIEKPDEFQAINTDLIARLKKMSDELSPNKLSLGLNNHQLWPLQTTWVMPEDGIKNPVPFTIESVGQGTYTLSALIKLYEDDGTVNPKITIKVNYVDGSHDVKMKTIAKNTNKSVRYEVSVTTDPAKQIKDISGWVLDHSEATVSKHAIVSDIKLSFIK